MLSSSNNWLNWFRRQISPVVGSIAYQTISVLHIQWKDSPIYLLLSLRMNTWLSLSLSSRCTVVCVWPKWLLKCDSAARDCICSNWTIEMVVKIFENRLSNLIEYVQKFMYYVLDECRNWKQTYKARGVARAEGNFWKLGATRVRMDGEKEEKRNFLEKFSYLFGQSFTPVFLEQPNCCFLSLIRSRERDRVQFYCATI